MTDKELLELAAKAAGYDIDFESPVNGFYVNGYDENGDPAAWWNPLTDDGDALRLAVKLGLSIRIDACSDGVAIDVYGEWDDAPKGAQEIYERHERAYAATRRAIVRAAAEIGATCEK